MNKKSVPIWLCALLLAGCSGGTEAAPSSPTDSSKDSSPSMTSEFAPVPSSDEVKIDLILSESEIVLDIFAEYDLSVLNFTGEVSWESSDASIAKVNEFGHVSCQGTIGEAIITATSAVGKGTCRILAKNQLKTPNIVVEDIDCFVNVLTEVMPKVRYDGELYDLFEFELVTETSDVIEVVDDNSLRGRNVGDALVKITGTWKGKELAEKTFTAHVRQEKALILQQNEFEVYSVNEGAPVKKNQAQVDGQYYERGELKDVQLEVSLDANPYLATEGNKIFVSSPYEGPAPLMVKGKVSPKSVNEVEEDISVTLYPSFDEKSESEEIEIQPGAVIDKTVTDFAGRDGVLKFEIMDDPANQNSANPVWAAWNARAEFYETTTKNGVSQYQHLVDEGYTLLSFDIYYTGQKGILMGAYGTGANSYFYNDVQVNRDDILIVDANGNATNTLVDNTWLTVVMDIEAIITTNMAAGQTSSTLYCAPCFVGDAIYFDNIRYHYDFSMLDSITRVYDRRVRGLTVDETNENRAITDDEFVVYSPNYISFEKGSSGAWTYDSTSAKAMDREARSKIEPYSLIHGTAVSGGYTYFHFTYKHISGTPLLYVYNYSTGSFVQISLAANSFVSSPFVKLFVDGAPIDTIPEGETIDIVVRIDGKSSSSAYLTSSGDAIFEIQDIAYYKDESFFDDLSQEDPIRLIVTDVDFAYLEETHDIRDQISVYYGSLATDEYEITDAVADSEIASVTGSVVTLDGEGEVTVTFTVTCNQKSKEGRIRFRVYRPTYLSIAEDEVTLHCGDSSYFEKRHSIVFTAIDNKNPLSFSDLNVSIEGDADAIEIIEGTIIGKSVGVATVTLSFLSDRITYSDSVRVTVFDHYRMGAMTIVASDANNPATYEKETETIDGVVNSYRYHADVASWSNKLDVESTRHDQAADSYKRIVAGHIAYVSYAIRLSSGTTGRIACVAPNGSHVNLKLSTTSPIAEATGPNDNISFYLDGTKVDALQADVWYRVVIDFSAFSNQYKSGYTCAEITNVSGTMHFADVRYYHDSIPTEELSVETNQ